MSKVIGFLGSPRKNGHTNKLVQQVLEGAQAAGAEVIVYDLNEDGIKGCQGCYYCRGHEGCSTKDKLQTMYPELKEAVGVVAGFPIYFHNIGGQSKQWIDRMFPMIDGNFSPRYPGKKVVTAYAQGNADEAMFKPAIESNDQIFKAFGWEVIESLLSYGGNGPHGELSQELLDKAYEAGKALVG